MPQGRKARTYGGPFVTRKSSLNHGSSSSMSRREPTPGKVGSSSSSGQLKQREAALLDALVEQRLSLRNSARVSSAVAQFWATLGKSSEEFIDSENFRHIHRRLSRVLAPELDDAQAERSWQEDWASESCGGASLASLAVYI